MILLDTDMFSLLAHGHPRVTARALAASDVLGITLVTKIEVLQARFDFVLKASNGEQLLRAQTWLERSQRDLNSFPLARLDARVVEEFEQLLQQKRLKKIGRADILIGSIALAHRATLVTRNVRHFQQIPGLTVENWAE